MSGHQATGSRQQGEQGAGSGFDLPAYLSALAFVEDVPASLGTTSYIWGGFALDVYAERLLREHHDVDYLMVDLHRLSPEFARRFAGAGWAVRYVDNGDLALVQNSVRIHLGHIEIGERVRWTHNGDKGSLIFPREWLRAEVVPFCGLAVHVVEPELEYVLKHWPQLLNPDWTPRDKDLRAREMLAGILSGRGVDPQALLQQVAAEQCR